VRPRPAHDWQPRHGITYYRCHPENNNRGRPDKYAGHPATIYMREDLIMTQVNQFFAERVFGPQRHTLFLADLDTVEDTARQERAAQRQRLQRKLADTVRKQNNVLRQAEDADPTDPFTQGLPALQRPGNRTPDAAGDHHRTGRPGRRGT
jgi:site-specific DNA recombinase